MEVYNKKRGSYVRKIFNCVFNFNGADCRIKRGASVCSSLWPAYDAIIYYLRNWKYAAGSVYIFLCTKGERGGEKLKAKAGRGLYVALLLFVGIPLPGTGAWTGTLAASFLDMDFKKSVLACMGGVLLAGVIMGVLSALGVSAFNAAF